MRAMEIYRIVSAAFVESLLLVKFYLPLGRRPMQYEYWKASNSWYWQLTS